MFKIKLTLTSFPQENGLEALDFRRKFGLADGTVAKPMAHAFHGCRVYPVEEGFARDYFARQSCEAEESVPLAMLLPGELAEVQDYTSPAVALASNLTVERAKELFIAARSARLVARVKELEQQVGELEAQLAATAKEETDEDE